MRLPLKSLAHSGIIVDSHDGHRFILKAGQTERRSRGIRCGNLGADGVGNNYESRCNEVTDSPRQWVPSSNFRKF